MKIKNNYIIFGIYLLLFVYVLIRANNLSFTHDESLSYTIINGQNTWVNTANNHQINTFFMSVFNKLFGNTEISLRLPNVLAFLLYIIGLFLIIKETKNHLLHYLGLSLVLLNPFVLDFFSLARGYGISLGALMISLVLILKKQESFNIYIYNTLISILFASLAVFSNLTLINYYIVIIGIFIYNYLVIYKITIKRTFALIGVIFIYLIPLFFAVKRLFLLKELGELYFGAEKLGDTFYSIIKQSLYLVEYQYSDIITLVVGILIIISFIGGIMLLVYKKEYKNNLFIITLILVGLIVALILEKTFFGAKYPIERTSLYIFPLYSLFLILLFKELQSIIKPYILMPIQLIIILFLLYNFLVNINLSYTYVWKYDSKTKEAMSIVANKIKENDIKKISSSWLYKPTIDYYIETRKLNLIYVSYNALNMNMDFVYDSYKPEANSSSEILSIFKETETMLCSVRKNAKENQSNIKKKIIIKTDNNKYVSLSFDNLLIGNQLDIKKAVEFWLINLGEDKVALQTLDGNYVTINKLKLNRLEANEKDLNSKSIFQIIFKDANSISLKSNEGKYVVAKINSNDTLFANSDNAWAWETFKIESKP